jgi:hypothetical protein
VCEFKFSCSIFFKRRKTFSIFFLAMKSKPSSKIGLPSNSKLFLFTTRISDVSDLNFLKTSSSTVPEQKKSSHLFGLICRPTSLAVLIINLYFNILHNHRHHISK